VVDDQVSTWRAIGSRFGIHVTAPCDITLVTVRTSA
jgi:hypothetical protein